jgi:hypothetical protein
LFEEAQVFFWAGDVDAITFGASRDVLRLTRRSWRDLVFSNFYPTIIETVRNTRFGLALQYAVPHLTTFIGIARIALAYHDSARHQLESINVIQGNAQFVLSELKTCDTMPISNGESRCGSLTATPDRAIKGPQFVRTTIIRLLM